MTLPVLKSFVCQPCSAQVHHPPSSPYSTCSSSAYGSTHDFMSRVHSLQSRAAADTLQLALQPAADTVSSTMVPQPQDPAEQHRHSTASPSDRVTISLTLIINLLQLTLYRGGALECKAAAQRKKGIKKYCGFISISKQQDHTTVVAYCFLQIVNR